MRSATAFGLTREAVAEALLAAPDRLPPDMRARYIDELAGEFARRLLEQARA